MRVLFYFLFSENYMLLYRKNIKGGIVYETYLKHAIGD